VDLIRCTLFAIPDALWLCKNERSVDVFSQDIRYAFRMLFRRPGFTVIAVFTLALGIGANTAIFSVVNSVLLRPLPFEEPERLLYLAEVTPQGGTFTFSPANFISMREQAELFEDIVAYGGRSFTLTGEGDPERITGRRVSAGFFELLGLGLSHGRTFLLEDDVAAAEPVVIFGHGFWQRRFGGDPVVVGRTVLLDGGPYTVIGISSADVELRGWVPDFWVPWAFDEETRGRRGSHYLGVLGRLKPGVSFETARTEVREIGVRLANAYPETNDGWSATARPLHEVEVGRARKLLLVLLGAVGFVLLIACANVANLMLARAERRHREFALRAALGAGLGRLVRQMLTESVLLAALGGAAGLALAYVGLNVLMSGVGTTLPRASAVGIDIPVLVFTLGMSFVAGTLVGVIPALQLGRTDLHASLKEGGRNPGGGFARRPLARPRLRQTLVVAEVALALMLVVGAGLLLKSFWRLNEVDVGFNERNLLTVRVSLPRARYQNQEVIRTFYTNLITDLRTLPGVERVGGIDVMFFTGDQKTGFTVVGDPENEGPFTEYRHVTPEFFAAAGVPLLRGRVFTERDGENAPPVVIVNEAVVRRNFPDKDPVGQRLSTGWDSHPESFEIVGVVGDVKEFGLAESAPPTMYWPHAQLNPQASMGLMIRTSTDPLAILPAVRSTVWRLDGDLPVFQVQTMEQRIARSLGNNRFAMLLLGIFAGVAVLLGAIGIYGVMAYSVSQRTQEVGVRLALGADRRRVLGLVLKQGVTLALVGVAVGLTGAVALGHVLASMLFEVESRDPWTLGGVAALLTGVALLACYLPARRAAKVDPVEALRYE
jgi:putative ABC transport system permease protein